MNKLINFFLLLVTVICLYTIFSVGLEVIGKIGKSDNYENINIINMVLKYFYNINNLYYNR